MSLLSVADISALKPLWTEAAPVVFNHVYTALYTTLVYTLYCIVYTLVSERLTSQSPAGAGAGRRLWEAGGSGGFLVVWL